jgi:hypothetical protein
MQFFEPRERYRNGKPTGIWDFCRYADSSKQVFPIGYCAGWHEFSKTQLDKIWGEVGKDFFADQERRRPFKDNYHTDGHGSAEEALECYRKYCLDLKTVVHEERETWKPCVACRKITTRRITVNRSTTIVLCNNHDDRKELEKVYKPAGIWSQ